MIEITHEYLVQAGYEYDGITYCKNGLMLAPYSDGYHYFSNGLSGGITEAIKFIHELIVIEEKNQNYKPEVILPLDRLPELLEKYGPKK